MRRTKTARTAVLAVTALAAGTSGVAIAAESPASAPPSDGPTTELDPEATININPQPVDALQQGGEIRLAVSSFAENWNPNHPDGNELDFSQILAPMSYASFVSDEASAFTLDENFVLEIVESGSTEIPAAPEGTEAVAEEPAGTEPMGTEAPGVSGPPCTLPEDPFTLTYTLNPEAIWNNGDSITAEDYKAYWLALNGVNTDYNVVTSTGYDQIGSVEAGADEFEVVVQFCVPYPDYEALFGAGLAPAEALDTAEVFNEGWMGELNTDWLTGPYTVGSVDANAGVFEAVPNPNWWGPAPLLDKIINRIISVDATPQAFANNEIDTFDIGPDPNGFAIADGTPGAEIRAAAGPNWRHFTMNSTKGLIQEQHVRQAIQMSLDRAAIGVSDLAGIPWPAQPLNNHLFVENSQWYQDNSDPWGVYNPEAAQALLEENGWVMGDDGVYARDGEPLTVRFTQITGVPVSENEAQLFQSQLSEVGFNVEIVDVSQEDWGNALVGGEFEVIAFTWIGTPFPFRGPSQLFGNGGDSNFGFSTIPEITPLLTQLSSTFEDSERAVIAQEIDQLLWEFGHTIPLYQRPELIAVNEGIANFGAFGFASIDWTLVGWM